MSRKCIQGLRPGTKARVSEGGFICTAECCKQITLFIANSHTWYALSSVRHTYCVRAKQSSLSKPPRPNLVALINTEGQNPE